jgi:hypothetical protein
MLLTLTSYPKHILLADKENEVYVESETIRTTYKENSN